MELVFDPAPQTIVETTDGRGFPVRRVLCLGRNYADHAVEMGGVPQEQNLPFFTKWAEAIAPDGAVLAYPSMTADWHFEVELVAALGSGGASIDEASALDHVWGYAVGVDMTRRDLQSQAKKAGTPWSGAKNGSAIAPVGRLAPVAEVGHPSSGGIRLFQNDEKRQDGDLNQMIWSVARTISSLSAFYRLEAGDLIFTGTPAGVGPAHRGDKIRAEIDGLPPLNFSIV